MTICIWKNLLGIDCPGCGMTRAILAVFHGHFALAWAYNKGVVIVLPLLIFIATEAQRTTRLKGFSALFVSLWLKSFHTRKG